MVLFVWHVIFFVYKFYVSGYIYESWYACFQIDKITAARCSDFFPLLRFFYGFHTFAADLKICRGILHFWAFFADFAKIKHFLAENVWKGGGEIDNNTREQKKKKVMLFGIFQQILRLIISLISEWKTIFLNQVRIFCNFDLKWTNKEARLSVRTNKSTLVVFSLVRIESRASLLVQTPYF